MDFRTSEQMRALDQHALAGGVAGSELMRRAGAGVARAVLRLARACGATRAICVVGRGNNGGDALVAATALRAQGLACEAWMVCDPGELRGDARGAWELAQADGTPCRVRAQAADWDALDARWDLPPETVVVDGLLGTGSAGAPRGVVAAAVRAVRRAAGLCRVVAIDLPSGLDADTGVAVADAVRADVTVTLGHPKRGFRSADAWELLGRVEVVDIGLSPLPAAGEADDGMGLIAASELAPLLPLRPRASHKGSFGHVLVVGGSRGFTGAPALAALGALRAGAGLVSVAAPSEALATLAAVAPEAMGHPLEAPAGMLSLEAMRRWRRAPAEFDVTVAGPGLGVNAGTRALVRWLLSGRAGRLLLDADALNAMAGWASDVPGADRHGGEVIVTPHPGEAARLLGVSTAEVQADRAGAVRRLADRTGAVTVLKGCGTLVAAPGGNLRLNLTGNPGMATGGSGDVLSGVIGALWARGLTAFDAACLGVYLHGTAGDLAAWGAGEEALVARDIIAQLGAAANSLRS